jgi:hypothetical protein
MSVDPSPAIETFAPQGQIRRRRRRRQGHRSLKQHKKARRFQRAILLVFLGLAVVLASLYFAQRFSAYQPPPAIME